MDGRLHEREARYGELKDKHETHLAKRKADYKHVVDANEYCNQADEEIGVLKSKVRALQHQCDTAKEQDMLIKDQIVAQLKGYFKDYVSDVLDKHKKEIAAMDTRLMHLLRRQTRI